MVQYDFGTIDREESGSDFATQVEGLRDAVQSGNMGTTAPTYKQAGTPWIDTSATPWVKRRYDGTDWIPEYSIDPTTNAIIIAMASLILASQAEAEAGAVSTSLMTPLRVAQAIAALSVPASRTISAGNGLTGGGNLSADRTINMAGPGTLTGSTSNSTGGVGGSHTHTVNLTAADVLPSNVGVVGSYAMLKRISAGSNLNPGSTQAGSGFDGYGNSANVSNGAPPSGTWRAMGYFNLGASGVSSLALRIA